MLCVHSASYLGRPRSTTYVIRIQRQLLWCAAAVAPCHGGAGGADRRAVGFCAATVASHSFSSLRVGWIDARAACVAVLRSGRGSAAYNKLLPLLRGFLRVPHAVVEDNVLALLGTGSGADFVEALTAPPPAKERAPS